jgi:hypothetical protein
MDHANPSIPWRKLAPAAAAFAAVVAASAALVALGLPGRTPAPELVRTGIFLDLTVTASTLVYWLAVRPGWLRPARLVSVVWVGVGFARLLVPEAWVLRHVALVVGPAIEATLVLMALRSPRLRALLRSEWEALGYGLGGWFRRAPAGGYSYLRGRPWAAIMGVVAFLVVVETTALHVVLAPHAPLAAWIASGSSLYALAWLAGDYHALRLGGLELGESALAIRFGLRWRTRVPWAAIAAVVVSDAPVERRARGARDVLDCRVLRTDVRLVLRTEVVALGPFGLRRTVREIALAVDAPERFAAEVRTRMRLAAPEGGS